MPAASQENQNKTESRMPAASQENQSRTADARRQAKKPKCRQQAKKPKQNRIADAHDKGKQNRVADIKKQKGQPENRAGPVRLSSSDIHRDFKAETHIGVARGSPLHSRPPLRVKTAVPLRPTPSVNMQDTRSRRPMLLMQLSYQTLNLPEMVLCDAPRTQLTRLTVAEPQQSVPRAAIPLWTHFARCARVLTDRLSLLKKIVNSLHSACRLH